MHITVEDYARQCADQGLRGDYSKCRADFTVSQGYDYSEADQEVWRTLCDRQTRLTERLAHRSWLAGVKTLDLTGRVPDFGEVSRRLRHLTGWELVAVPGLIPNPPFFEHLASRRFPVTNWLRSGEELDYIVEPDMFHDFFGHVPALTQPAFADFMQMYGARAKDLVEFGGEEMMGRLYWYTAEFALIEEPGEALVAIGAGLMSSFSELRFAVEDPEAHRVAFDVETVMRTGYEIDKFQRAYFVLPSFDALRDGFEKADLEKIVMRWKDSPALDPGRLPAAA